MEMQIRFGGDGVVTAVYADDLMPVLSSIGGTSIVRASNVEPVEGGWEVAIVDGPKFGPIVRRDDAIAAEVQWLRDNGRA